MKIRFVSVLTQLVSAIHEIPSALFFSPHVQPRRFCQFKRDIINSSGCWQSIISMHWERSCCFRSPLKKKHIRKSSDSPDWTPVLTLSNVWWLGCRDWHVWYPKAIVKICNCENSVRNHTESQQGSGWKGTTGGGHLVQPPVVSFQETAPALPAFLHEGDTPVP